MSKKVKRTISLIIAAIMLLSTMSVLAFADTYGETFGKEFGPHDCVPAREADGTPVWTEVKSLYAQPTCTKSGLKVWIVKCDICGKELDRIEEFLPKLDSHVAGEPQIENVKNATCAKMGSFDLVTRCKFCNKVLETQKVAVARTNNHVPAPAVKENCIPATCAAEGSYDSVIYCKVCKMELQRTYKVVPKNDFHMSMFRNPGKVYSNEHGYTRTCADGEDRCLICGELLNPAIPHLWDKGVVTTAATIDTTGIVTYTCLICGATKMETIAVKNPKKGDVDCDGRVTTADARLILRYAVGLGNIDKIITDATLINTADVDKSGKVEPADARLALRLAVGLRIENA